MMQPIEPVTIERTSTGHFEVRNADGSLFLLAGPTHGAWIEQLLKDRAERDALRADKDEWLREFHQTIASQQAENAALLRQVGVLRSQLLGQRVGLGVEDGASFTAALAVALDTEAALNAVKGEER